MLQRRDRAFSDEFCPQKAETAMCDGRLHAAAPYRDSSSEMHISLYGSGISRFANVPQLNGPARALRITLAGPFDLGSDFARARRLL